MTTPPPIGYHSTQHAADSAFLARWGKRLLIVWLSLVSFALVMGLLVFLLVGGCAVTVLSGMSEGIKSAEKLSPSGVPVTSAEEMRQHGMEIDRQLEARKHATVQPSSNPAPLPLLDSVAQDIARWDYENAQRAADEATRKHKERQRAKYQGFPGHYDADSPTNRWKRSQ